MTDQYMQLMVNGTDMSKALFTSLKFTKQFINTVKSLTKNMYKLDT